MNPVRILPIGGRPLEFESPGVSKSVFTPAGGGFLVGPEGRLLETTVLALLGGNQGRGSLAESTNPLLFCGPEGVGKTHLLRGITTVWRQANRKRRGIYIRAVDFARKLAGAIDTRTVDEFQHRYRKAALLAVDDIEFLRDKPAALSELLHTIDAVRDGAGRVLLGSLRYPTEISGFDRRLAARLEAGMIVATPLPGPEVRTVFLKEVAAAFRTNFTSALLQRFALAFPVTLPAIYGRFATMYFTAHAEGHLPGPEDLKTFLRQTDDKARPGIEEILQATAKHFGLKPADLKGRSRRSRATEARAVAVYLARNLLEGSYREIGTHFGNRDHKTIAHYCRSIEEKLPQTPDLRRTLREIREALARQERNIPEKRHAEKA